MKRAVLVFLLLLVGSQGALAGSFNYDAMRAACEDLKRTQITGYTVCRVVVDATQEQRKRYDAASAEWRAQGSKEVGEAHQYRMTQLAVLRYYYRVLTNEHPTAWEARLKLIRSAAAK